MGEGGIEMTQRTIVDARQLALAFADQCNHVLKELIVRNSTTVISGTKASGYLRRLSMELTRKLAELRMGK